MRLGALALITVTLAGAGIALTLASPRDPMQTCESITVTLPSGELITAELADTWSERARGLSNRDSLAENHGMLFIFESAALHTFWMKNTRIPLDIIWLNDGQVVDVATLQPERDGDIPQHTPRGAANAVLELNAGSAARHGVKTGERITWTPCT